MNTERLHRLPSYRELQARKAAEALAQRNRQGLALPFEIAWFNGKGFEIEEPAPKLEGRCTTCEGSGKVFQEHQAGCHVGGEFPCPDCDGAEEEEAPTEQPKFRKGDRLVCVESWGNWLTAGKVYEVRFEPQSDAVFISDDDGDTILCHVNRFRLATAEEAKSIEQPKFREGDRLICVDAEDRTNLTEGGIYVARKDSTPNGFVQIECADDGCHSIFFATRFQLAPAN